MGAVEVVNLVKDRMKVENVEDRMEVGEEVKEKEEEENQDPMTKVAERNKEEKQEIKETGCRNVEQVCGGEKERG